VHVFFLKKVDDLSPSKYRRKVLIINHFHPPDLPISYKWTLPLPGGALTTFPGKFGPQIFFSVLGVHMHPVHPSGYAYVVSASSVINCLKRLISK